MSVSGRDPSFGYFLIPNAADPLLETAREVERLGLDYVGVQDHPYQRRFVDTFSLMAAILATTTTLRAFPDVANLPLRPPAVLAKTAATLDVLSGGRFELGLGAGAFWDAIEGYGGTRRTPGESLDQLAEGRGDPSDLERRTEPAVRGRLLSPARGPFRAGAGPRHRDLGRSLRPAVVALDRPARRRLGALHPSRRARPVGGDERAGRRGCLRGRTAPGEVRRVFNVNGSITDGRSEGFLNGPIGQWADELGTLVVDHRAQIIVFWGAGGEGHEQLRRFAEEVVPATRAILDG